MTKDEQLFLKHISDLANAAYQKNIPTYTDFLSLYEQDLFLSHRESVPPIDYTLNGGTPFSERRMICFLPEKVLYAANPPISILEIVPVQIKFSEELTHRDYLGALMNLGIERAVLGDILIQDKQAYLFCKQTISDYIRTNLSCVKHTNVICRSFEIDAFDELDEIDELDDLDGNQNRNRDINRDRENEKDKNRKKNETLGKLLPRMEEVRGSVASSRLDSVLAVVFPGSRSKLSGLIEGKKVFVNSRLQEASDYHLKPKDVVSVRGYGKFIFQEVVGTTKKGRQYVSVMKYR